MPPFTAADLRAAVTAVLVDRCGGMVRQPTPTAAVNA